MKPSEDYAWMDARVEAYLDAALPPPERAAFERHLAGDAHWEAEVFLARQVRTGLQALPQPACPPAVLDAVLARVPRPAQAPWTDRLHAWLARQGATLWRPALAMAMLLLLVVTATFIGRPDPPPYAQADVERARAEVEWTLAYLSEVGKQTGRTVRHDVISERMVSPMQQALGTRRPPNETQR